MVQNSVQGDRSVAGLDESNTFIGINIKAIPVDDEMPVDPNLLTGYKRYNLKNRRDIMPTRPFHLFN